MQKIQLTDRHSGVELLKILGMLCIVAGHVAQTLSVPNGYISYNDYLVDLNMSNADWQYIILAFFRYGGAFGNTIFFVCSAWFLLDSRKLNKQKILQMAADIWTISMVILLVMFSLRGPEMSVSLMIKSVFPTFFSNNWYLTCYLLFYAVHPFLNFMIEGMTQKQLLAVSITTGFLYLVVNYFRGENGGYFFTSALIVWMVIYFILAYIKKYLVYMSKNVRLNLGIVLFSGTCSLLLFLFTNFAGMRMEIFNGKLQLWNNCSPLLIMLVIGLLNLARSADIKINIINGIAALSMYVYVIHENILLRIYIRPAVWQHIYEKHGYQYILGWQCC